MNKNEDAPKGYIALLRSAIDAAPKMLDQDASSDPTSFMDIEIVKKNAAKEIKRLRTENATLNIKLDAAMRDAERYTWVRNPLHAEIYLRRAVGIDSCKAMCGGGLDAAIDAAIRKEQP